MDTLWLFYEVLLPLQQLNVQTMTFGYISSLASILWFVRSCKCSLTSDIAVNKITCLYFLKIECNFYFRLQSHQT